MSDRICSLPPSGTEDQAEKTPLELTEEKETPLAMSPGKVMPAAPIM